MIMNINTSANVNGNIVNILVRDSWSWNVVGAFLNRGEELN
jgi:hypothetical protein